MFFGFLMASCTSSVETRLIASQNDVSPNQQLQAIDSLMWRQPDSALMLLVDFAASPQADSLDAFDGHYFQMLLSELLYKNDYEQTNRAELLTATAYYDSLAGRHPFDAPLAYLQARAHYMDGVGWYEQDSIVPACQAYLKALQVMESHFKDDEIFGLWD